MWPQKRQTKKMQAVERRLIEMNAPYKTRCMYCEHSEATHLDHFEPLSCAPALSFTWSNLILSCEPCNSRAKRGRFLSDGGERPIDPTAEDPDPHLQPLPSGTIHAVTARGAWSVEPLDLNRTFLSEGRRDQWDFQIAMVLRYADKRRRDQLEDAERSAAAVRAAAFPSMLRLLLRVAGNPALSQVLLRDDAEAIRAAIQEFPEILDWGS